MRSKRSLLRIMSAMVTLFLAVPAFAEMAIPYGWYLEGNVGSTKLSDKNFNGSVSASSAAGSINAGYKFMPYFATEIGVVRYSKMRVKNNGVTAGTNKLYSYDLALRGIFPLNVYGFEVFAKLGIGRLNSQVSISNTVAATTANLISGTHNATGLYIALGMDYYFTQSLSANAQWARQKGNNTTGTADLWALGLSYLFDIS